MLSSLPLKTMTTISSSLHDSGRSWWLRLPLYYAWAHHFVLRSHLVRKPWAARKWQVKRVQEKRGRTEQSWLEFINSGELCLNVSIIMINVSKVHHLEVKSFGKIKEWKSYLCYLAAAHTPTDVISVLLFNNLQRRKLTN